MKNKVLNCLVEIIFGSVGLLFLIIAGIIFEFNYIPEEHLVKTTATIIDIDYDSEEEDFNAIVSYYVDGVKYIKSLDYYSNLLIGDEIEIYYDVNDPSRINDSEIIIVVYVFGGIGLVFALVAGIIILFKLKRKKLIIWLKENGNIVNAKYVNTILNKNYTVNNKHPYIIISEWVNHIDNKLCVFKSENIWVDPTKYIETRNVHYLRVYVNPNNVRQYYVDIDNILENINNMK